MKIAFIVPEFPSLSQTFVLNQITGLIDRGHQVDIFAPRAGEENEIPPEVIHYKLLSNTSYLLILPDSKTMRAMKNGIYRMTDSEWTEEINAPSPPDVTWMKSIVK